MDQEKIGRFICGLRKGKGMTQKALAKQLGITDKAVSKWERGLSCPDTALLPELSALFGVSVGELLKGERAGFGDGQAGPQSGQGFRGEGESFSGSAISSALLPSMPPAADRRGRRWRRLGAACFSLLLLVGILVCSICDLALNAAFSWSLYSISACVFAWLTGFPLLWLGAKGVFLSLLSLSLAIFPFLAVLDRLIAGSTSILPVGVRMAGLAVGFLWAVFLLFRALKSRWLAAALSLLLGIPLCVLINLSLMRLIGGAAADVWDLLTIGLLAALAAACFWQHRRRKNGR